MLRHLTSRPCIVTVIIINPYNTYDHTVPLTTEREHLCCSVIQFKLIMPPPLIGGDIKRCFCLTSVCRLSTDVCRVHREYSWRPQLPEARRAGRRRPGVYGLELGRSVRRVQGRGHIVAASRLQLVKQIINYYCKNLVS